MACAPAVRRALQSKMKQPGEQPGVARSSQENSKEQPGAAMLITCCSSEGIRQAVLSLILIIILILILILILWGVHLGQQAMRIKLELYKTIKMQKYEVNPGSAAGSFSL